MPDSSERGSERVQLGQLLKLASLRADEPVIAELSPQERHQVDWARHLLDVLDTCWQPTRDQRERVQATFRRRLADEFGESWPTVHVVTTLGELVTTKGDELPTFAVVTFEQLKADPTPINQLLDPDCRPFAVGMAMRRAQVPKTFVRDFVLWVSRVVSELTEAPGGQSGYLLRAV